MTYNNGFPVSYPQMYPQFQYQQPQFQQQTQQGMTPPIVHADIVQIQDKAEGERYPVAAGSSQMMITKDEQLIIVKSAYANGQANIDVYEKRPPEKQMSMDNYVTWDKLEERLAAMTAKEDEKA